MDKIRSFIAIEIPRSLQNRLEENLAELKRQPADVKWVRPEGVHLTLKFLGSISEEDLDRISAAVSPVVERWAPFELRVRGLGAFPSLWKARVVWVGIDQGGQEASSLQTAIEKKLGELGFPPEPRPFRPHLTLGRVRSPKAAVSLGQVLQDQKDLEFGNFYAREVCLFKSDLRPAGAIYTQLRVFPMRETKNHPS